MPRFKVSNLPEKTHMMHDAESRWRQQSWQNSLNNHAKELEELLTIIDLYGLWKNRWPRNDATKILSNEIYTDAYMSIHLACYGLYKNAYMSLRSQFETALRLAYFSEHSLEFKLWESGDEKWIQLLLKGSDVWGQEFKYFLFVPEIKDLENRVPQNLRLITGDGKLKTVHSKLSQ